MTDRLLVSCILTTYNRGNLIKRSLESILNQTYLDLEILVIDDCSFDNTREIIESYNDKRIKYICHEKNMGLAQARNTGMEISEGYYIAFLDDDDEWLTNKIEKQIEVFEKSDLANLGMVSCGIKIINDGSVIEKKEVLRGDLKEKMIIDQPLVGNGSCVLIKKSVYKDIGGFDIRWKRGIDGFLFIKIAQKYDIDYSDEILVNYYEDAADRITTYQNLSKVQESIDAENLLFEAFEELIKDNTYARWHYKAAVLNVAMGNISKARELLYKSLIRKFNFKCLLVLMGINLFPNKMILSKRLRIGLNKDGNKIDE
jgi:glycosyltransferase involved in cell wall biosynthesis